MRGLVIAHQAPCPLEALTTDLIPLYLLGQDGTNRAVGVPCQIRAETDLAAIWAWLNEFKDSPNTFRSYRKEVERFYNWALWACNRPLSSLTREDMDRYNDFMAFPAPTNLWCEQPRSKDQSPRSVVRGGADWKPFKGSLMPKSRALAMTVIGVLFSYLVAVRYLSGNPMAARRRKRRGIRSSGDIRDIRENNKNSNETKAIELTTLQKIITVLQSEADAIPTNERKMRAKFERMLFVIRFLANTGLRREELANLVVSDGFSERNLKIGRDCWFLRVLGKGDTERTIAFNDAARAALKRYHRFHGLSEQYRGNHNHVLLPLTGAPKSGQSQPISAQMVYYIVKNALAIAEIEMKIADPGNVILVSSATPHSFRHTFATICLQLGHPIRLVQEQLGHESIETTALYQHPGRFDMYEAFNEIKF